MPGPSLPASFGRPDTGLKLAFATVGFLFFVPRVLSFLRGFPSSKKGKAHGYLPRVLVGHIVVSMIMVARYIWRTATEAAPVSTRADLLLGLVEALSGWILVSSTPFKPVLWKASFQTMIPLYTFAVVWAQTTGSPSWHATSTAFLFWFVLIRLAFRASLKLKFYPDVPPPVIVHLISASATLCWADWASAVPFYYIALGLLARVNEQVTQRCQQRCVRDSVASENVAKLKQRQQSAATATTGSACRPRIRRPPYNERTEKHREGQLTFRSPKLLNRECMSCFDVCKSKCGPVRD